ncbi:iron complex transport system permease protein [Pseudonocardia ammonioxydans]|uniref:Iron complex transport system permease protein n=1 Tax=Pseudonocardia ammonioxydans TaxID=260086 RepID=A0A1I4YJG7_PSUAM|nr:iron ABC transporter permease [Pseudonocardia ammonioxydans]SFN38181.1 iron complex transport system permease protein [Pseudonocardia ammonioxydans]
MSSLAESTAVEPSPPVATTPRQRLRTWLTLPAIALVVLLIAVFALATGRYGVPPVEVARLLIGQVLPIEQTWYPQEASAVLDVRMPRVLLALLVGGGLALGGAVLQGVFRNPLVSPEVIGVSAGASFGGVLALVLSLGSAALVGGAFLTGLVALVLVLAIARLASGSPLLMVVLGGVVVSAFFSALVSLLSFVADPYETLPAVTFWLLGSLATASYGKVLVAAVPIGLGVVIALALRWRLNILSLGEEDAAALGVPPRLTRNVLLVAVALIAAGAVAVSGVVGWVGLVVPHICRLIVGSDHRVLLPASLLVGAGYLLLIDTLSRSLTSSELPLGILTAIIGAPFFILLLSRFRKQVGLGD